MEAELRALKREVKRLGFELQSAAAQVPFLRVMLEASRDGVALLDDAGRVMEHNRAFTALVATEGVALVGRPLFELLPPADDRPPSLDEVAPSASGEAPRIVRALDGTPVELLLSATEAQGRRVWVASARALTDDALQARALHEARQRVAALANELDAQRRFGELFDRSPDALLLVGPDGRLQQRSALAAAMWPDLGVTDLVSQALPALASPLAALRAEHGPQSAAAAWEVGDAHVQASLAAITLGGARGVLVAARDVTPQRRAEGALEAALRETTRALAEREVLLKEIHHRVKNNLQIVSSMLVMQADRSALDDVREALGESVRRVRSMALVHRMLYGGSDLARVHAGAYAQALSAEIHSAFDSGGELSVEVDELELPIDQAIPVGLLLNELLSNAHKHGRSSDGRCHVTVEVRRDSDEVRLAVSDRGPGLPIDFDQRRRDSLGITIVTALVKQLGGRLRSSSDGGARFEVVFAVGH
jgi:PAS domain S-box-containing protein